ncbi:MAG TPA: LysR family transcriptional regulator [Solirubrobacteraceae bacterium]|nr:LysR family transcriptional regulator [Solirubrobacteraceae bacterium]
MELRQLEYFVAVAKHRHFGRAAEAVYVTQPALSQQVQRLEAELGIALLRRTSRGVELTPAGEDLLARAETILAEVTRARGAMDEHAGVVRGAVRVAATTADALHLPDILAAFHREHPGVRLALRHASAGEVLALVRRGAVDLAVLSLGGEPVDGLTVTPLADEPLRAIAAPGESFPAVAVAIEDLRGRPFVLGEPGTALRATVMAACQEHGFSPVPLLEVSDPVTVRFLVSAGLGVSLVPQSWLDQPGPPVSVAALVEPAPRHALSLLSAGELPPAGRLLKDALQLGLQP